MQTIEISCDVKDTIPLESLEPLQGNLKSLSEENFNNLKKEILETGFAFPVHVWISDDEVPKSYIIGGHQRVRVLEKLKAEGFSIPDVPIVRIKAKDLQEAKRRVLQDVSQYGHVEQQGMYEFLVDADLQLQMLSENFDIPDFDTNSFISSYSPEGEGPEGDGDNIYTSKIQAPIYEPKGSKPETLELYDLEKTNALIAEIDNSDLPSEIKAFLKFASFRHIVFNYGKIAEFYSHAEKPAQELMENSALVIIDFNKAIEKGFVVLSDKVAELYD